MADWFIRTLCQNTTTRYDLILEWAFEYGCHRFHQVSTVKIIAGDEIKVEKFSLLK
jgi:hypothetical protein